MTLDKDWVIILSSFLGVLLAYLHCRFVRGVNVGWKAALIISLIIFVLGIFIGYGFYELIVDPLREIR